jgi:hypothetical protein
MFSPRLRGPKRMNKYVTLALLLLVPLAVLYIVATSGGNDAIANNRAELLGKTYADYAAVVIVIWSVAVLYRKRY